MLLVARSNESCCAFRHKSAGLVASVAGKMLWLASRINWHSVYCNVFSTEPFTAADSSIQASHGGRSFREESQPSKSWLWFTVIGSAPQSTRASWWRRRSRFLCSLACQSHSSKLIPGLGGVRSRARHHSPQCCSWTELCSDAHMMFVILHDTGCGGV